MIKSLTYMAHEDIAETTAGTFESPRYNPNLHRELHGKTVKTALLGKDKCVFVFDDDSSLQIEPTPSDDGELFVLFYNPKS